MRDTREGIPNQRLMVGACALSCLAATIYVALFFFSHVNFPMPISNDSVEEYQEWVIGSSFWDKMHHNMVSSWLSSLGLYFDTAIGPYPVWSYIIGYLLLLLFVLSYWRVAKDSIGVWLSILLLSTFMLFWFQQFNLKQSLLYVWRIPEVGQQLATLGVSIYLVRYSDKLPFSAILGLIAIAFIFSNTHCAYVIFTTLLVLLFILDRSLSKRVIYLLILLIYICYMTIVDGTFAELISRYMEGGPSHRDALDYVKAVAGLQSQIVLKMGREFLGQQGALALGMLYSTFLYLIVAVALFRLMSRRDRESGVYLMLVLSQLGIVVLVVLGRIGEYGLDVMHVPRYSSYSVVILFAVLWYLACNLRPQNAFRLLAATAVVGLIFIPATTEKLAAQARWYAQRHSKIYSLALRGKASRFDALSAREQKAFLSALIGDLEAKGAAGFGQGPWTAVQNLGPIPGTAPSCRGRLQRKMQSRDSDVVAWVYRYSVRVHEAADFGFVLSADGTPVALSPETLINHGGSMWFYVPRDVLGATLYLARLPGRDEAEPEIICQRALKKSKQDSRR